MCGHISSGSEGSGELLEATRLKGLARLGKYSTGNMLALANARPI